MLRLETGSKHTYLVAADPYCSGGRLSIPTAQKAGALGDLLVVMLVCVLVAFPSSYESCCPSCRIYPAVARPARVWTCSALPERHREIDSFSLKKVQEDYQATADGTCAIDPVGLAEPTRVSVPAYLTVGSTIAASKTSTIDFCAVFKVASAVHSPRLLPGARLLRLLYTALQTGANRISSFC